MSIRQILFIGERINNPKLSDRQVEWWRRLWERQTWDVAIRFNVRGGCLGRLGKLVPELQQYRVVNVLPPDNKPGTWDKAIAEEMTAGAVLLRATARVRRRVRRSSYGTTGGRYVLPRRTVRHANVL